MKEFNHKTTNAKEILKSIRRISDQIVSRENNIQSKRNRLEILKKKPNPTIEDTHEIMDLEKILQFEEKSYSEDSAYLLKLKNFCLEIIERIADYACREILIESYFSFKTTEQIAISMNYSTRWVYQIKRKAIQRFEDIADLTKVPVL